jgi:hypothetical protein
VKRIIIGLICFVAYMALSVAVICADAYMHGMSHNRSVLIVDIREYQEDKEGNISICIVAPLRSGGDGEYQISIPATNNAYVDEDGNRYDREVYIDEDEIRHVKAYIEENVNQGCSLETKASKSDQIYISEIRARQKHVWRDIEIKKGERLSEIITVYKIPAKGQTMLSSVVDALFVIIIPGWLILAHPL